LRTTELNYSKAPKERKINFVKEEKIFADAQRHESWRNILFTLEALNWNMKRI